MEPVASVELIILRLSRIHSCMRENNRAPWTKAANFGDDWQLRSYVDVLHLCDICAFKVTEMRAINSSLNYTDQNARYINKEFRQHASAVGFVDEAAKFSSDVYSSRSHLRLKPHIKDRITDSWRAHSRSLSMQRRVTSLVGPHDRNSTLAASHDGYWMHVQLQLLLLCTQKKTKHINSSRRSEILSQSRKCLGYGGLWSQIIVRVRKKDKMRSYWSSVVSGSKMHLSVFAVT